MAYTSSQLQSDVERMLESIIRELESKAACANCDKSDVYIPGKDSLAREYARKIADLVAAKVRLQ